MKNQFDALRKVVGFFLLAVILCLTACGAPAEKENPQQLEAEQPVEETAIPGTWTVPEGWVKAERYSTEDKIFYVEEGHEEDEQPDNISIEVGTNRYGTEDHLKFRDAIVRQLTMQAGSVGAELTGEGTFTDQEDVLYIFAISEEDVVTKQFYIVGDQRYCLVHLTSFTGSESAEEAARAMADSFIWE